MKPEVFTVITKSAGMINIVLCLHWPDYIYGHNGSRFVKALQWHENWYLWEVWLVKPVSPFFATDGKLYMYWQKTPF